MTMSRKNKIRIGTTVRKIKRGRVFIGMIVAIILSIWANSLSDETNLTTYKLQPIYTEWENK
jgi:hypothetical protein